MRLQKLTGKFPTVRSLDPKNENLGTVGRVTGAEIHRSVLRRITVYDGQERVATVVKRVGQDCADTAGGVFRSRIEAAPAIPAKGGAS